MRLNQPAAFRGAEMKRLNFLLYIQFYSRIEARYENESNPRSSSRGFEKPAR